MVEFIQTLLSYLSEDYLIAFFQEYAYRPGLVYMFILLFMTGSSFGIPIPEEIVLISAGLVAYMASHPAEFPPPYPDAHGVNLPLLMVVCFIAVLGSDILIYMIGRFFGTKLLHTNFFRNKVGEERLNKINHWFQKYGFWASGAFRFMPGIRFPGHLSCGFLRIPFWKFLLVDGSAALFSVPTQVYLVSVLGATILSRLKEVKLIIMGVIILLVVALIIRRLFKKNGQKLA